MKQEVKEILGQLIFETEYRINQVYKIIESDPNDFENDKILLMMMNQLSNNLEEFNK